MFYFHPYLTDFFFSDGLKPPTSHSWCLFSIVIYMFFFFFGGGGGGGNTHCVRVFKSIMDGC